MSHLPIICTYCKQAIANYISGIKRCLQKKVSSFGKGRKNDKKLPTILSRQFILYSFPATRISQITCHRQNITEQKFTKKRETTIYMWCQLNEARNIDQTLYRMHASRRVYFILSLLANTPSYTAVCPSFNNT